MKIRESITMAKELPQTLTTIATLAMAAFVIALAALFVAVGKVH